MKVNLMYGKLPQAGTFGCINIKHLQFPAVVKINKRLKAGWVSGALKADC